jgi:hypothetical protein
MCAYREMEETTVLVHGRTNGVSVGPSAERVSCPVRRGVAGGKGILRRLRHQIVGTLDAGGNVVTLGPCGRRCRLLQAVPSTQVTDDE